MNDSDSIPAAVEVYRMEWLWQGIISNWLSAVLIMASGILIAYLKKRSSSWLGPAMWGLGACALVAFALLCFWGISAIPKTHPPDVTPQNVEANIRAWCDDFGLSTKREESSSAYFALIATLPNGDPITVSRLRAHDRYIALQAVVTVAKEHKDVLRRMSSPESNEFESQIALELSRSGITYVISHPLDQVILLSRIPITPTMTEDEFMRQLDLTDSNIAIVRNVVQIKVAQMNRSLK